jgi:hypothetical protein
MEVTMRNKRSSTELAPVAHRTTSILIPLLMMMLSCTKDPEESSQNGCLHQADQDYAECGEDCTEDETCTDECADVWCEEVEACGIGNDPGLCSDDTAA